MIFESFFLHFNYNEYKFNRSESTNYLQSSLPNRRFQLLLLYRNYICILGKQNTVY